MVKCDNCKNEMKKDSKLISGNVIYEKYLCPECGKLKMVCLGLNDE